MKPLVIAANWKSNKTVAEAQVWMQNFQKPTIPVVLCVPFTLLSVLKTDIVQLGAQDVSPFPGGAYTGEVNARQIKELADWVIIGHSERRKYFGETDEMLVKKVEQAKAAGLKIIFCVQDEKTPVSPGVDVVAYEPVAAIGTGTPDTPENANAVASFIKNTTKVPTVLYGGSVTPDNVTSFVNQPAIDGVLVGGASLDPMKFFNLITACNPE